MRLLFALFLLWPAFASAQDSAGDLVCAPEEPELPLGPYVRALSLDLRGVVPNEAEIAAASDDAMIAPLLDEWMASDAFTGRVVRRHRALLWNEVGNVALLSAAATLNRSAGLYFSSARSSVYRGALAACVDQPATFDAQGRPTILREELVGSATARREGYVLVRPYWAPETEVKVCAFDAQAIALSGRGVRCDSTDGLTDAECGCGENLDRCAPPAVLATIAHSIGLELEQRIVAFTQSGEGYDTLFSSRRAFVNGPLVHYYRHLAFAPSTVRFLPLALDADALPDLPFSAIDEWTEIELPGEHAGILTSPAYLLRFQTNRARASRFHDAFLCEPFTPPTGGIPASTEAEAREVDLQLRSGCRYCHAQLEPAAAHWGRWSEQGAAYLAPIEYPSYRADCFECAMGRYTCPTSCSLRYVTSALAPEQRPYLGMLRAYEFRRPEHEVNVEEGPARLVAEGMADGRLPRCVARKTAEWLLGREVTSREREWLDALTRSFVDSGLDYRRLISTIATSGVYRRAR